MTPSEEKREARVPTPSREEPPEPTFKQYLIGWGAIFLALVLLGVLFGVLMRALR